MNCCELLEKALGVLAPEGDVPLHHRARHVPPCESMREAAGAPEGMVRLVCVWGPLWVYIRGDMGRYTRAHAFITSFWRYIQGDTEIQADVCWAFAIHKDLANRARSRDKGTSQGTLSNNHRIMLLAVYKARGPF